MAKKNSKDKDRKGKDKKGKQKIEQKPQPEKPPETPKPEEPCLLNCTQDNVTYRPNSVPGLHKQPKKMAVVGSEDGSYDSLCILLRSAFICADRVYVMVPWGSYVVYRIDNGDQINYYLFEGCTSNVNRFRYLDLSCGTAGLLYFKELHKIISYIIMSRSRHEHLTGLRRCVVDDVHKQFASYIPSPLK